MGFLIWISIFLFYFSLLAIILVVVFTPLFVSTVYLMRGRKRTQAASIHPSVTLISVVRNAETIIGKKIKNSLSLEYPSNAYEIIIFSDSSSDRTEKIVKSFISDKIRLISSPTHMGKSYAINHSVSAAKGDILILSDADAILDKYAVVNLIKLFADPDVGGVCGNYIISETGNLGKIQRFFVQFEQNIKEMENLTGYISANTGALFAIRRNLFQTLPENVADDLFISLSIIEQHYHFVYEPEAKAYIKPLSKNPVHDVKRRRRVVTQALTCFYAMRELLNPLKYGIFSFSFLINKVLRNLFPLFIILLFVSSIFLSAHGILFSIVFYCQIAFYLLAIIHWQYFQSMVIPSILKNISSIVFYFCVFNYGTLLGILDFIRGRRISKWEP